MTTPRGTSAEDGWAYFDGCAVCPRCNRFISCENDIPAMRAAAAAHDCHADPGTGHYERPPDVAAAGWYWEEPDGTFTPITRRGGLPARATS